MSVVYYCAMLTAEIIAALAVFAFATSITPGPNNLMLLASGATYGWGPTIPHMLGIFSGFTALVFFAGTGLGKLLDAIPAAATAMQYAGIAFLTFLAYKTAFAVPFADQGKDLGGRPISYLQAVGFQWVNPKAWAMGLGAYSTYAPPDSTAGTAAMIALIFGAINLPCISCWTLLGTSLRRLLNRPWKLRMFNISAAGLLLASLTPIILDKV